MARRLAGVDGGRRRTSTNACSPRARTELAADRALRLLVAVVHPRRRPGRHGLAAAGAPGHRGPAARRPARLPPLRRQRRRHGPHGRRRRAEAAAREVADLATGARRPDPRQLRARDCAGWPPCAAARRSRASPTSTRRCCPWWPGRSTPSGPATSTARSSTCATSSATSPGCAPGPSRWPGGRSRRAARSCIAHVTRIHELQLLVAEGAWEVVEEELGARSADLVGAHGWLAGEGYYTLGEVRRLRGDAAGAAQAYATGARASATTRCPAPPSCCATRGARRRPRRAAGRARGRRPASAGRGCCSPPSTWRWRWASRTHARTLVAELEDTASWFGTPGLSARADQARAALLMAEGRPAQAIPLLERAAGVYRDQRHRHATATVHEALAARPPVRGRARPCRRSRRDRAGGLPAPRRRTRRRAPRRRDGNARAG